MKKVKATLGGLSAALVLGTLTLPASAATVTINATATGQLNNSSGAFTVSGRMRVGSSYDGWAVFQLPDITGLTITSADLKFVSTANTFTFSGANLDAYVLGYLTSYTGAGGGAWKSWYSNSSLDTTTTGTSMGTNIGSSHPFRVGDNVIINGQSVVKNAAYDLTSTEQTQLGSVVQSLYTTYGATTGNYLVLRMNPDSAATTSPAYIDGLAPILTLTTAPLITIPEPATAALGAGLLAVVGIGRRRR